MSTNRGTLFNIPLLALATYKYQTASVRRSTRGNRREEWCAPFCRQGNWSRSKIMIQPVNNRSRHKSSLLWLPALIARSLLLIWRDQAVKTAHNSLSSTLKLWERKKVSDKFYLQPLLNWICLFPCFFLLHTWGEESLEKPQCSLTHLNFRPWASNSCRISEQFQAVCPSLDICEAAKGLEREEGDFTNW